MIHVKKNTLFLSGLLIFTSLTQIQAAGAPIPSSEQDMNQIVQELEKATKEIDTFVKALPPEEQAEFNRIVQQVEQKMSETDPSVLERFLTNQMNPDELDQFLGNVFEGITPPEQKPDAQAVTPKQPQKKEEKPTPKEVSKLDRALDTLNTIIKRTDSFIIKAQELPELAGKVKRWGKRGILYDWEPSFEWDKVKKDIESLRQLVQKLIEKDPKNSTYKYLNDFIAQETLVNNVEKLKTTLVEYEPTIETSAFGIEKMSANAKKALTRTISAFTEGLYRLKITEDIDKIFEKYEPRAKELREEKEKAEKAAETAGQRSRFTGKKEMVMAGKEERSASDYSSYSSESPDYSNYYSGSSYEPSYDYSSPSYNNSLSKSGGDESASGGTAGSTGSDKSKSSGNGGKPHKEGNGKEAEDASGKGTSLASGKSDNKAPVLKKESEPIEKSLKEITEFMNIAGLAIKHEENLKNIGKHIADETTPPDERIIELPLSYLDKAEEAINKMKQEIIKKNDTQAASRVHKRLETIVKEHKSVFDNVIKQIKDIQAMDTLTLLTTIPSQEKRIAYLGELRPAVVKTTQGTQKEVKQPQEEIPVVNLSELSNAWEAIQKAVKEFSKKPEPVMISPTEPVTPTVSDSEKIVL